MAMTKWFVEASKKAIRRFGKFGEELNELGAVTNRCIIQGINEIDPSSGKTNKRRLEEEIADVLAQINLSVPQFNLDLAFIQARTAEKERQMAEWEALFDADPTTPDFDTWLKEQYEYKNWYYKSGPGDMAVPFARKAFEAGKNAA